MKNRAKCKLCNDVIESFHRFDYVTCKCEEIAISGGTDKYECFAKDFENFIRMDDLDNEIPVKVIDLENANSNSEESEISRPSRNELMEMLDLSIKNIENLPQNAMTLPITHYDFYSFMMIISSILKSFDG